MAARRSTTEWKVPDVCKIKCCQRCRHLVSVRPCPRHGVKRIKSSQISEVVSDVVESQSGYLDVSFQVVEGGGFRVLDVIVVQVPGGVQQKRPQAERISENVGPAR